MWSGPLRLRPRSNVLGPSLPRKPVVSPGGDAQLPAGLQLGACVQQRAPSVRGAPGPGLGAWGGGGEAQGGFGVPRVLALRSLLPSPQSHWSWGPGFNGSAFQVWVIANKVQGSHSLSRGTVCHRTGVQPREPKGQGWDYGIGVSKAGLGLRGHTVCAGTWRWGWWEAPDTAPPGSLISWALPWAPGSAGDEALSFQGGWDHISVRANATRALRGKSQERAAECSGERGLPGAPSGVAGVPQEAPGLVRC